MGTTVRQSAAPPPAAPAAPPRAARAVRTADGVL